VEVQLTGVFGTKWRCLQLDDHIAAQLQVVEQQINEEFVSADVDPVLPSDESEARA
jgi:hypothetical protein